MEREGGEREGFIEREGEEGMVMIECISWRWLLIEDFIK